MIPTKQPTGADEKCTKGAIKGPRPSPLKIRQNSRPIHKQSSSSSSSSSNSLQKQNHKKSIVQKQNHKKPIVVYARSPKIIHTKAHDFMALVQKLTGFSRDHALQDSNNHEGRCQTQNGNSRRTNSCEGNAHIDEIKDGYVNATASSSLYSPLPTNPYLADIPLFTPNSADFFCSPRPLFWFSDMMSSLSPNIGNSLSSSLLEAMKGLPEY